MTHGTIVRIVEDRGFLFIEPDGIGPDVFAHVSVLRGLEWNESLVGERVVYETTTDPKTGKPKATIVQPEQMAHVQITKGE